MIAAVHVIDDVGINLKFPKLLRGMTSGTIRELHW